MTNKNVHKLVRGHLRLLHPLRVWGATTLLAVALQSCFTGVESTPKITYKDVTNNQAQTSSPEESLAAEFVPESFATWREGKPFYVTSPRISLVLKAESDTTAMPAEGETLLIEQLRYVADYTGKEAVIIDLITDGPAQRRFAYNTNATRDELLSRRYVEIPFTVDLDMVSAARQRLSGRKLYVKTDSWLDAGGQSFNGRKFVPVTVTDVTVGNEIYPFRVTFKEDLGQTHSLMMSQGGAARWMPRDFAAVFSLSDIRAQYPHISDATWTNIIHSRVSQGMTKQEVSLALGAPKSIDRGHDQTSLYERWVYPDGVYVIFQDGLVEKFNR